MNQLHTEELKAYDPRWFVWTITFLLVSGIGLTTYILFTDQTNDEPVYWPVVVRRNK